MKTIFTPRCRSGFWVLLFLLLITSLAQAQTFVHPGGLHTQADLDRMKARVAAGAHPWIDGWNQLITDAQAQNTYTPAARANMGGSRQRASRDAHAAYLNALRWYISGDTSYADCAIRICNAWSSAVNQVPTGTDIPGLSGIPIFEFALVGELLRICPRWAAADFTRFKDMMLNYFYPVCHDFLTNHNGACISHYWSNWDICNTGAILAIGVLCDDTAKYNEAVTYFKSGAGMGSIMNAVYTVHPGNLGQLQESGRDQAHAQLAVGMMGYICEVAWNQGLDLYGYSDNRLLAGAEYAAKTNLWQEVPYTAYNNCDNANQRWVSINSRGRFDDRHFWELLYNHYVVRKGLSAPNVKALAELTRPEHGSIDHFGYGTLTFTLSDAASPYPPLPAPPAPTGLTVTAGVSRVSLKWQPADNVAKGYRIQRAIASGGPYTTIASWTDNTIPQYTDASVTNDTTYYYVVAAVNQSGVSPNSAEVSATPAATDALPAGWVSQDIGTTGLTGTAGYAPVSNKTFVVKGAGTGIGGTADAFSYTYGAVSGDATITARLFSVSGTLSKTGIMIRESLAPDAKTLVMKLGDAGWRQAGLGVRSATAGSMTWTGGNDYTWQPAWFRLERSGDTFTAYESSDGAHWFTVGTSIVAMADTYYIGLAASSGNTTAYDVSVFDNITITGGGNSVTAAPSAVTATAGNTQVTLGWNTPDGAASYVVKRATVSGGPYTSIATGLTTNSYTDTSVMNGTTYYYVVTALNFVGESPGSAEASAMPMLSLPLAPTGLSVERLADGGYDLSWTGSVSATGYIVKRAVAGCGPFTAVDTATATGYRDTAIVPAANYYYTISAINALGEGPATSPQGATAGTKRSGTLIGTTGSWNNNAATTKAAVVDGNLNTFFDAVQGSGAWVGIDLGAGSSAGIKQVRYAPRSGYAARMVGGVFQGANAADFSDAVMLFTVTAPPVAGSLTRQAIADSLSFRYLRYLSASNGFCNVAEVEFWGEAALAPVITSAATVNGSYGVPFSYAITASNNATHFSAAVLPDSLRITDCNGIISGIPAVTGVFPVVISAANAWGTGVDMLQLSIKRDQSITFNALENKRTGDPDFDAGATSSAGLPVTYTSSDTSIATIVNCKIHIADTGRCTITALQAGDSVYWAAAPVAQTFTVAPLHVQVQYKDGDSGQTANNTVRPYIKIMNADSIAVTYNELTVRYWFTAENYAGINTWIDYAQIGNSKVKMKYVQASQPRSGALGYIEYSFDATAGTLQANGNSGEIKSRFANKDWAVLNETDDYSRQSNTAYYATNDHITLYRNGALVWGVEPAIVPALSAVKVYYQNQLGNTVTNTISTYLTINNEGNVPISYQDITARYWFTKEGTAGLNSWIDYAKLGISKIAGRFVTLSPATDSADTYFEIKIDSSAGTLYPLCSTGNIQYRITKTDWSNFNEANDYSWQPAAAALKENSHITVYYKGQLVYGAEPFVTTANARSMSSNVITSSANAGIAMPFSVYPNPVTGSSFFIRPGNSKSADLLVKVLDVSGNVVLMKMVYSNNGAPIEMNWRHRPLPGIYLVQLNNGPVVKIVVQ